ncbi:MAG: potassium-transporting ATPase subunit C [Eggerthellaceae bacterium]
MNFGKTLGKSVLVFILFSVLTGVIYTGVVTVIAQLVFPYQANGDIITTDDGSRYCMELGQTFQDDDHMWGRMQSYNVDTFTDTDGNPIAWAGPTNLSPASEDFSEAVQTRIAEIRAAHPEHANDPIPSDLVTTSGSGLDPDISPAAAEFQVERLAKNTGKSEDEIRDIIAKCTTPQQFGVLGQDTVNVLKVNLMLDGKISE